MTGTKTDRLVILLSGKPHIEKDKLLGVPVILSSTGVLQCEAIIQVLKDWEVTDVIIGMVFDTTASNTGKYAGCCTILEKELQRALLWLACNHHKLEVHIKHVADHINGARNSPSDALCVRFQKKYNDLDRSTEVDPNKS